VRNRGLGDGAELLVIFTVSDAVVRELFVLVFIFRRGVVAIDCFKGGLA
jgi:hypothetical protein